MRAGRKSKMDLMMAGTEKTVTLAESELNALVAEAAKQAVADALGQARAPSGVSDEVKELFSELVLQMTEVNQQGQPKTKISPEEARKREAATQRMWGLITDVRRRGVKPEYRLVTPVYLNERMVLPYTRPQKGGRVVQNEIYWDGAPSNGMQPICEDAQAIYAAFKESLGSSIQLGRLVGPHGAATKPDDRPYVMKGGLVVKGDPDHKASSTASEHPFADALQVKGASRDNNDPNSEFVNVLGTVAQPLRRAGGGLEAR